jgi:hypothetical protein
MGRRESTYPGSAKVEGVKKDIDQNWETQRVKGSYKKFDSVNFERYAAGHLMGRNSSVVRITCFFSLMRAAGLTSGTDLTLKAARVQHFTGDTANKTNAAHCIPGQIMVGNDNPWNLGLFLNRPQAALQLRIAFGQTSYLPRVFNVADTAHERVAGGSGSAFLRACITVAKAAPVYRGEGVFKTPGSLELAFVKDMCRIDRTTVRNTFELWLNWVGAAYELASEAVRNNKFVENGMSKSEVLEILWLYKKLSSAAKPSALLDQQMDEIERVFNIKS